MGRRKLRFDLRKNYERKKRQSVNSCCAVPDKQLLVRVARVDSSSAELPEDLPVRIPVSSYMSSSVPDIYALHKRLLESKCLPAGWTCSVVSATNLALCRLSVPEGTASADVMYMVTISCDFTWKVCIGQTDVPICECEALHNAPSLLTSPRQVVQLLALIESCKVCVGNADKKFSELVVQRNGKFIDKSGLETVAFYDTPHATIRHTKCELILASGAGSRCHHCVAYRKTLHVLAGRLNSRAEPSTSSHTNYRYHSQPELITLLHEMRHRNKIGELQLSRLRAKLSKLIEEKGVSVDEETEHDLLEIVRLEDDGVKKAHPEGSFQMLFWKQQQEASKRSAKGMRWHPLFIKWCIYLRHQSSKAYETLRDSGCIALPSQRTLRDYTNCVKATAGFSAEVDRQLLQAAGECPEWQRLVVLLIDEMYIREDLVYNKHSGKLVGFVDLGSVNNHLLAFERKLHEEADTRSDTPPLAKTMMAFMVRGLFTPLRFAYAQFPCEKVTGELLFQPFWDAVYRLERMTFKVLGATMDGASVNRRLVRLHDAKLTPHKVKNIHAPDKRDLYFFSDPPHLIKTVRNCWSSKCRTLWKNGKEIAWRHLVALYYRDKGKASGLAMVPKLKLEHLQLTSFSKMRVDLAAQVLSESVSCALKQTGGAETSETWKFTSIFDKFFDLLNVGSFTKGMHNRKRFQYPYRHSDDFRLDWLEDVFLPYLESWESDVETRTGFTKTEQDRMLLSHETRLGLRMTAKSFIGIVKYLFSLPEVKQKKLAFLSMNLCQDPLENYFGCQRQRGATSDNPNAVEYYQNTQALRVVNSLCRGPVRGNCRGKKRSEPLEASDCVPLPKRRRKHKAP